VPLVNAFPELKSELVRRYQAGRGGQGGTLIEHIFAKLGDVDCFMAIVQGYAWQNKRFDGLLDMAVRDIALRKEPVEGWSGAYEVSAGGNREAAQRPVRHAQWDTPGSGARGGESRRY
jgi:hypothetical protein